MDSLGNEMRFLHWVFSFFLDCLLGLSSSWSCLFFPLLDSRVENRRKGERL